jgi:hypothetical protein
MNLTESIAVSLWWTNVTRAFRNNFLLSTLTLCGSPNPIAMQLGGLVPRARAESLLWSGRTTAFAELPIGDLQSGLDREACRPDVVAVPAQIGLPSKAF